MGRNYYGDIEGEFWFGVQSSYDPEHFGVKGIDVYNFYGCGCMIKLSETQHEINPSMYCSRCYSSYDNHKQKIIHLNLEKDEPLFYTNSLAYIFNISDLPNISNICHELANQYEKYIETYEIIDEHDSESISYDITLIPELVKEDVNEEDDNSDEAKKYREISVGISRYCLGKQIEYCVNKKGMCSFIADL